jgi:hypothetical protein
VKTHIALIVFGIVLAGCSGSSPATPTASQTSTPAAVKPDETVALTLIRKINEAEATFFKINRRYAIEFEELIEAHLMDSQPSSPATGYKFNLHPTPDAAAYKMSVVPSDSSAPVRHFFTDQSGVIHAETGKDATAESPTVQ